MAVGNHGYLPDVRALVDAKCIPAASDQYGIRTHMGYIPYVCLQCAMETSAMSIDRARTYMDYLLSSPDQQFAGSQFRNEWDRLGAAVIPTLRCFFANDPTQKYTPPVTYTESQFLTLRTMLRTSFASMGRCAWYPGREGCEYRDRILLMGAPGSGKTTIVRAFANIVERVLAKDEPRQAHALDKCCRSNRALVRVAAATANAAAVLTSAASNGKRDAGANLRGTENLASRALTMHSAFGIPVARSQREFFTQILQRAFTRQLTLAKLLRKPMISLEEAVRQGYLSNTVDVAAIVLDETSMMSQGMYDAVQLACLAEQFQVAHILKLLPFETVRFPLPFILPDGRTFPRHYAVVRRDVLEQTVVNPSQESHGAATKHPKGRAGLLPLMAALNWYVPTAADEARDAGPGLPMVDLIREAVESWRAYFAALTRKAVDPARWEAGWSSPSCLSPPIVLVGDFAQLPTVSTPEFPAWPFWTHRPSIESLRPCVLAQNVRQSADPTLLRILSLMRSGQSNEACKLFNDEVEKRGLVRWHWSSDLLRHGPVLTPFRSCMASINEEYLKRMRPRSRWACTAVRVSGFVGSQSSPEGPPIPCEMHTLKQMRDDHVLSAIADVIAISYGSLSDEGNCFLMDGVTVRLRYNYDAENGLYNGAAMLLESIGLFCSANVSPDVKAHLAKTECKLECVPITNVNAIVRSVRVSPEQWSPSSSTIEVSHRWHVDKCGHNALHRCEDMNYDLPEPFDALTNGYWNVHNNPSLPDRIANATREWPMHALIAWQDRLSPEEFSPIVRYAKGAKGLEGDRVQARYVALRLRCPSTGATHIVASDRIEAYILSRVRVGRETFTMRNTISRAFNLQIETDAARTVHQAQGLTLPDGFQAMLLQKAFEPGMFYVALSRLTQLDKLTAAALPDVLPEGEEETEARGRPRLRMPEDVFRVNQNAVAFMREMENAQEAVGVRGR